MKELFDTTDTYEEGLLKNKDLRNDQKKEYSMMRRVSDRKNELFFEVNSWEDPEVKVQVHPKSIAYMLIAFYVFFCLIIVMIFAAMHKNPYSKTATTTTASKPTYSVSYIGSNVALPATESQLQKQYEKQGMDPTEASKQAKQKVKMFTYPYSSVNSKSILDISKEKRKAEEEEKRKQNEKEWDEKHANDGLKEVLWILIPGVVVTLICVYLFRRQKRIDEFDGEMLTPYRERADEITDEIRKNEDNTNHLKNQIHQLYKEMKALDPMPEKVLAPETVKMHKKQRKRWE